MVSALVKAGANVNNTNNKGFTALHLSAGNSHSGVVKVLLRSGADRTIKNINGLTPSEYAIQKGHVSIVNLFKRQMEWYQSTVFIISMVLFATIPIVFYCYLQSMKRTESEG